MANPKRRHSSQRQATRRAANKLRTMNLAICPQCKSMKLPHRVCPHCGYYKGNLVIQIEKEEKKKK